MFILCLNSICLLIHKFKRLLNRPIEVELPTEMYTCIALAFNVTIETGLTNVRHALVYIKHVHVCFYVEKRSDSVRHVLGLHKHVLIVQLLLVNLVRRLKAENIKVDQRCIN